MRSSLLLLVVSVSTLSTLVACGSSPTSSVGGASGTGTNDPASTSAPSPAGPQGQLGGTASGNNPANQGDDGCSDSAKLVYVVSDENNLYSFSPETLTFIKIGPLNCAAAANSNPNSMAVDRSGTAWVNYDDDTIFKVSTKDASCQPTTFQPKQGGRSTYGMAFATSAASTTTDSLFIIRTDDRDDANGSLATLDLTTFALTPVVGDFSASLHGVGGELTGTGDGRLFGFFSTSPNATLAQIDEGTAATSGNKDLTGIRAADDFAFSFWGGDFWFYTSDGDHPSSVTRLRTSGDGSLANVMNDVGGFHIVGAGVSTCAPTSPVK